MNYYPFHIGDYLTATKHLSWDEDLAYRRLIECYYSTEEMLPLDRHKLHLMAGAHTPKHRAAVDKVLAEFFTETATGWRNDRCEEEINAAADKRMKAKLSADKRWQCKGNANAMRTQCDGNAPNPNPIFKKRGKGKEGASSSAASVPVFEGTEAWEAWVKFRGKKPPTTDIRVEGQQIRRGWYFPTEFPPLTNAA